MTVKYLPSNVTTIEDTSCGLIVTAINNGAGVEAITVRANTTVDKLVGAIQSTNGLLQHYRVLNQSLSRSMGRVVTGDLLEVTAEDTVTTETYAITVA